MAAEQREHPRHLKRVRLRFRGADERWRSAYSKDISTNGLYIVTSAVPTTRRIEIEIFDGDKTIALRGTILRGKKVPARMRGTMAGGAAVRLVDIPDAWCALCLDLEEMIRARGGNSSNSRFIQVTTEVSEPPKPK